MPPLPGRCRAFALRVYQVPQPTLLDSFMGYVAAFLHLHHQSQTRSFAMSARALRTAGARRPLRVPARTTTALALRDADATEQPDNKPPACRSFHNYFVTHLPSSSMHPDSRSSAG